MQALKSKTISLLKWSEKYTKTDMIYLFKNGGWILLGQMTTTVTAFLVMIAMANFLPKEVLGEYRYVLSWISILALSSLPGLGTAITQSTSRGFSGQLDSAVRLRIKWALLGALGSIGIGLFYWFQGNINYAYLFWASAPFLVIYNVYFTYYFFLQGLERFDKAAMIQFFSRVLFALVMIPLTYFFPSTVIILLGFLLITIIGQYGGYAYVRSVDRAAQRNSDPDLENYSKFMTLLHIPTFLSSNLDKVFVGIFLGPVELAIYFVAITLPFETGRIGRMLGQLFLPKFAKKKEIISLEVVKNLTFLFIPLLVLWGLYAISAGMIFQVLFPEYPEAVSLSILGMLLVLATPTYVIRTLLIARKKRDVLRSLLVIIPIIQTIILFTCLFFFGLVGAVAGLVIGGILELVVSLVVLLWLKKL